MVSLPIINLKKSNVKDLGENGGHKKKLEEQCNWCNTTPKYSDILWHPTKIYDLSISVAKINPEYSDILYNLSHFPGSLVCRIRQVPLYIDVPGEVMQVKCMLMEKGFKINLYSKTHLSRMQ